MKAALVWIAALAACETRADSVGSATSASPAAPARDPAACRNEAEALGKLLAAAEDDRSYGFRAALVVRTDLPRDRVWQGQSPFVELHAANTTLSGQVVASSDRLHERLSAAHQRLKEYVALGRYGKIDPRRVYFVIDAATSWKRVVEAVRTAKQAGLTAPAFLFEAPSAAQPPARVPFDDRLDEIVRRTDTWATELSEFVHKQSATCAPLIRALGRPPDNTTTHAKQQIRDIPPALIACNCNLPLADFRATMWRFYTANPPTRAIALDPTAPAQRIALPANTPWRTAQQHFTAKTKNVAFALR